MMHPICLALYSEAAYMLGLFRALPYSKRGTLMFICISLPNDKLTIEGVGLQHH